MDSFPAICVHACLNPAMLSAGSYNTDQPGLSLVQNTICSATCVFPTPPSPITAIVEQCVS